MNRLTTMILITLLIPVLGCDEEELAKLAKEHAAQQSEQNREMAKIHHQVAEGAKRLVEADAAARKDLIQVQQNLDEQRTVLNNERKQIAHERHRDPIIANSISIFGILLASVLPLVIGIYVLKNLGRETPDDQLAEILIQDMTSDHPVLLPAPAADRPAVENKTHAALPPPEQAA
jgi:hypothetical protein